MVATSLFPVPPSNNRRGGCETDISSVVDTLPEAFVAVTRKRRRGATSVGRPDNTPVAGSSVRPAGNAGLIVNVDDDPSKDGVISSAGSDSRCSCTPVG